MEEELKSLVAESIGGDLDAVEALIRRCHGPLFGILHLLSVPEADIEDVAQDTMIQMYRSLSRYDASQPFQPWLHSIARHVVANYWRSRTRERSRRSLFQSYLEQLFAAETDTVASELDYSEHLGHCLEQLSERQREVLKLSYEEGRTSDYVAQILGSSGMAIRKLLSRTRRALRTCLESSKPSLGSA